MYLLYFLFIHCVVAIRKFSAKLRYKKRYSEQLDELESDDDTRMVPLKSPHLVISRAAGFDAPSPFFGEIASFFRVENAQNSTFP